MKKRLFCLALSLAVLFTLCACGQKATTDATADTLTWQDQYDLGVRYLSEGNYEEAILAFTAAIEIDPKRPEAYIGLADVYTAQGDTEKAAEILRQALETAGETEAIQAYLDQMGAGTQEPDIPQVGPAVDPLPAARTEELYGDMVEYDANGRIIRKFMKLDDETMYWERTYLYDAAGLLVSTHEIRYATHMDGNPPDEYIDCEYDGLGRLIKRTDQILNQGNSGVTFVHTTTYQYNGTQVQITIDDSEPETAIPTWYWSVTYDMSDPLYAVLTGNRGYASFVELTEYDWVDADPVINYYGKTVKKSAYDGNGSQLPWSEGWYLESSQHPEWWYQP